MVINMDREQIVLKNKVIEKVSHVEDCKRIKKVLLDEGYDLTLNEVEELWYEISDNASSSWLSANNEEDIKYWLGLSDNNET